MKQGTPILILKSSASENASPPEKEIVLEKTIEKAPQNSTHQSQPVRQVSTNTDPSLIFAGPAARRIAREFGVQLNRLQGTGRKGRITKEDVIQFIKQKVNDSNQGGALIPKGRTIDFAKLVRLIKSH